MTAIIATNVTVQVESTLGGDLGITAITKDNPGVASLPSTTGLTNGDVVVFTVTAGMVELNRQAVRVANIVTDTSFELEGLDTTTYTAFTACTCKEVTAWHTMGTAQSISMPNPDPEKLDITTLIDNVKQVAYGLPEAPDGSIGGLYDPSTAANAAIKAATRTNSDLVMRVLWAGGQTTLFNALVSGGSGFEAAQNQPVTAPVSFSPQGDVMFYAS